MRTITEYINELNDLTECKYGRNRIEINKKYGTELAEDIKPLLKGDFSSIKELEEKYKYLNWYHDMKHSEFRKMPLELRRIKEETSSYMTDKMCYFHQIYYDINCIKKLYTENKI